MNTRVLHLLLRSLATSLCSLLFLLPVTVPTFGQSQPAVSTVPRLIKFSGTVKDAQGNVHSGPVGITFALYKDEQGGTPLWLETQNLQMDSNGRYTAFLGASNSAGIPQDLFASGEARWLGIQVQGQAEQPRVMLLAVPYALKAADAETIGGLPPSAFVLAAPSVTTPSAETSAAPSPSTNSSAPPANPAVTGLGTVNFIPLWDSTSDIVNSVLFQTGSGATVRVGINNPAPSTTLDVKGTGTVRGAFSLPATATATATAGKNSQSLNQAASSFNSGTNAAVNQIFRWQAEPTGNNTTTPSATMNLLFGSGTSQPTETGLKINNKGIFTFADTQTFPGVGTISGVTATGGLIGGGTSGNVTVALTGSCALGQILQWGSVDWNCANVVTNLTPGTDLIETGSLGNLTLSVDTTLVPQLNTGNTFTANQTVNGNLSATGTVTASSYQIGSNLFGFGSFASANAFLGFGGSVLTTGTSNTAAGAQALVQNATGSQNTAIGSSALLNNTSGSTNTAIGTGALNLNSTGSNNTASGASALQANTNGSFNTADGISSLLSNTTGSFNSALGYLAGPDSAHANLSNSTAIGSLATVTASNSMVLGSIAGVNGAGSNTNVGIGTTAPAFALDVRGTGNFTGPITFATGQTFPGAGTITGVTAGTDLVGGGASGSVTLNVDTTKVVTGVVAGTDLIGGGTGGLQTLSLDTTKVPLLAAANSFTNSQAVSGNLTASGAVSGSSYQIGSYLFAFGDWSNANAFLGFAGNTKGTGVINTGVGEYALASVDYGAQNTAVGFEALIANITGCCNTAIGEFALASNTTGSSNSAVGLGAGPDAAHPNLSNTTAVGALAQVTASNSLVLGSINGVNGATASTNVGIGTTAPTVQLQVQGNDSTGTGVQSLTDNTSTSGNSFAVVAATSTAGVTNEMVADGLGTGPLATPSGYFGTFTNQPIGFITGNVLRMFFDTGGKVGIGTKTPDNTLSVNGSADKVGGGSWGTFSDGRLKTLGGDFQTGLSAIQTLHPVRYRYKEGNGMGITDREEHIGFVAQEVQKVIPEAVSENSKGYLLVNNDPIIWTMLNAIKEQQREIEDLRGQLQKRTAREKAMESRLTQLERNQHTSNSVAVSYQPSSRRGTKARLQTPGEGRDVMQLAKR